MSGGNGHEWRMLQCQKDSSGGFGIVHLFWRSPLLYPLQCPPSMRRNQGTLHHRWRMALFGAIQLPSSWGDFKAGQKHGTLYAVRDAHALFDTYQKGGGERRWGEMSPRLGVGVVPKFPSIFSNPTPPLAPQQHRAKTAPSTSQRLPSTAPFRSFRSGWPELTRADVRHQSPRALPGSTPAKSNLGRDAEDEMPLFPRCTGRAIGPSTPRQNAQAI